ncbi:MAG: FtsW/RodA/SpoVE family cell cycle protein [Actinomycetota bacterium]
MTATGFGEVARTGQARRSASERTLADAPRPALDWPLFLATVAVVAFGVVMVFSAGRGPADRADFGIRQSLFATVGLLALLVVSSIDYRRLLRWWPAVLAGSVVSLIAVLSPLGTEVRGTRGWFRVGVFAIQPAEFAKLALICGLAVALHTNLPGADGGTRDRPGRPATAGPVAAFGWSVLILGVASLLVLAEGESGTVLIYCAIALGMLATAGIPARFLALLVGSHRTQLR